MLKKLLKNPLGAGGIFVILLAFFIALFAYALMPDDSPNANNMHLVLAGKPPGFTINMLEVPLENTEERAWLNCLIAGTPSSSQSVPLLDYRIQDGTIFYREYLAEGEGSLEKSMAAANSFGKVVVQGHTFVLGTDKYGRDLLSRILLGTRVSFSIGFISVFISLLIGIPLGAAAGYYGGFIDKLIMWFINVIWSIPTLLMVIALTLALGKGFWQVFVAVGLTMWVEVARVVRGQFLSLREKEYVQAAQVLGFSNMRVIFKHILPNALAPIIVISAANFAAAILIESGLSFLGIGAQPPMPSWGSMIKDHYAYLIVGKAYLALAPGIAIMLLVLAFMMLGNALRDALDVRLR